MLSIEKLKETENGRFLIHLLSTKGGLLYGICVTINSFKSPQMESTLYFVIGTVPDYS